MQNYGFMLEHEFDQLQGLALVELQQALGICVLGQSFAKCTDSSGTTFTDSFLGSSPAMIVSKDERYCGLDLNGFTCSPGIETSVLVATVDEYEGTPVSFSLEENQQAVITFILDSWPEECSIILDSVPLDCARITVDTEGEHLIQLIDSYGDGGSTATISIQTDQAVFLQMDPDKDGLMFSDGDLFPFDPSETFDTDSDGIGNNADLDDDGDGVSDVLDPFPLDETENSDSDLDGVGDNADAFPMDPSETLDTDLDGIGNNSDADDDGDGVDDELDAFPLDAEETSDMDADGIGDNSDSDVDGDGVINTADPFPYNEEYSADTDNDGMPDTWEIIYGLDPNNSADALSDQDNDGATALEEFLAGTIPSGSLDFDGNEKYDALTDGLVLLRGMFGLDGSALVNGVISSDAVYTESLDIESRIENLGDLADVDGNGQIDALTDGLLTLRYLFGLEGDALIKGVVAEDATRTSAEDIMAHLELLTPSL
jgi:hypothetical protein